MKVVKMVVFLMMSCGVLFSLEKESRKPAVDGAIHVDAAGAAKLLKGEKVPVVLDVRTKKEFEAGHVEGAVNVDFYGKDFAEQLGKLDRKKAYLVHCRSGGRSGKALEVFKELGFERVYHLDGGWLAWEKMMKAEKTPASE